MRLFSLEKDHKSKPFSRENSNYSAYSNFFSVPLDKSGKWVYNIYAIVSVSILYTRICDLSIGERKFEKNIFGEDNTYEFRGKTQTGAA